MPTVSTLLGGHVAIFSFLSFYNFYCHFFHNYYFLTLITPILLITVLPLLHSAFISFRSIPFTSPSFIYFHFLPPALFYPFSLYIFFLAPLLHFVSFSSSLPSSLRPYICLNLPFSSSFLLLLIFFIYRHCFVSLPFPFLFHALHCLLILFPLIIFH